MKKISVQTFLFLVLIVYLTTIFLLINVSNTLAQTMSNSSYVIEMGNLNSFAGKPTGGNYKLSVTGGQTGSSLFSGTNYRVKAGFQYIHPLTPFRFSISTLFIDFGVISPTSPVTRTNDLTVSFESGHGYQVYVNQNHNLRVDKSGSDIQPTRCDSGTCTTTTASAWTSSLTYGFGYRCDNVNGTDCDSGFSTSTFYKQFVGSPSAVVVMSSPNVGLNRKTRITYKVNVPGTQPAGLYTNVLNYIAFPTF